MSDYILKHHGIKGQKWGVRRYQNADGSLTSKGKTRYRRGDRMATDDKSDSSVTRRVKADYNNLSDKEFRSKYATTKNVYRKRVNRYGDPYMNSPLAKYGKKLAAKDKNNPKGDELAKQELSKIANSKRDKIASKYDRKIARSEKQDENIRKAREKNLGKIGEKYDKKIAKANESGALERAEFLESKKQYKIADFNKGTEYINAGAKRYNDTIRRYRDVKIASVDNKMFKNDPAYKKAVADYTNQVISDMVYYQLGTKINYASEYGRADYEKRKR